MGKNNSSVMSFVSQLCEKDLEKAKRELNEEPASRDASIKALLSRCKSSPKIPAVCWPRLDPGFLLRFLRVAKFDLDKALDRLEKFFEIQKEWPELYGDFRFETVKHLLEDGVTELMPKRDENGVATLVFRLEKWDPKTTTVHEVYRAAIFLNEFMLLDESIQVNGTKVVGDQGALTWAHITAQPMRITRLWSRVVETYPFRNKKVAMIKFPGWFMTLYGIFSQFSSQKSRERIMFVGRGENLKKLYDEIPEKYLPEDLGGEIKAANQKQWVKRLEMVSKQIEKDFSYLKALCSETGTFRKLDDDLSVDMEKMRMQLEAQALEEEGTSF